MSTEKPKNTVAYILKKFPVLSETFILNELLELEAQGVGIHIFSLERPNDPRFHEDLPKLKANISYVPNISNVNSLWRHNTRASQKYGANYKKAFRYVLKHGKPSLMWRFMQSCYVANQMKRFDVCHFHSHFATRPTTVASLVSMITGKPYSFTAHAMDIFKTKLSDKSLRKKVKRAKFVVAISEYNKQHLSRIVGGDCDNIAQIYNGIDLERFKYNGESKRSTFTFLCVARFVEKKGHKILIEACEILHKKGLKFKCWLVGKGRLRSPIRDQVKESKLNSCIKLLGPHSHEEVMDRCRKAHAYVLPCIVGPDGNRDGLPVSLVEALASGLPVITTPMTGNLEVVEDKHNGLIVPFNDAVALAEAMEKVMQDKTLLKSLSKNARGSVVSKFNHHATAESLRTLFQESMI